MNYFYRFLTCHSFSQNEDLDKTLKENLHMEGYKEVSGYIVFNVIE